MSITMYDDVRLDLIPPNASAVAGYVNGRYVTFPLILRRWPKAHHLSIAVTAEANADCLDVERGDARIDQAPAWVKRQMARGIKRPVVYCAVSDAAALLRELRSAGIGRSAVRLWTAHYTGKPHRCSGACGFGMSTLADATQWTDKALGRSLDGSLCADAFFGIAPKPPKPPPPPPPPPKPKPPAPPPLPKSSLFLQWVNWRLGLGPYRKFGRHNRLVRPWRVPKRIPAAWWRGLAAILKRPKH